MTGAAASGADGRPEPIRKSALPCKFDDGPGKYRIGLVVLASDHATERDFRRMLPSDEVVFYVSRVENSSFCTVEELGHMGPRLSEASSLLVPDGPLDVLAYSCTSGSIVIGIDTVRSNMCKVRPELPCATPITGLLQGMEQLGVRRIAMVSPYVEEVTASTVQFMGSKGIDVVSLGTFNLEREIDMTRLTPDAIYEAALRVDCPEADAVCVPCTAIRAVDVIERLEQKLGKPVLTSIQALFWESVRLAGYRAAIPGFGRLLMV